MRRKLTSALLSFVLVFTSVDMTAFATEQDTKEPVIVETQQTEETKEENEGLTTGASEIQPEGSTEKSTEEHSEKTTESKDETESTKTSESVTEIETQEKTEAETTETEVCETNESDIKETESETELDTETIVESITDNSNVKVTASNSFGNLLVDAMEEEILELEQSPENNISDIIVDGKQATVEFRCVEDAILVVAVYNESGTKMLASGKTEVTTQQIKTKVSINIDVMPSYFIVRGYLVNIDTMKPLSSMYESPMYTKEMQELLAKTIDDFEESQILNLDESRDNNFAVADDNTKIISNIEGENIISQLDNDTQVCVIENANEEITSLQEGEIFVYEYEEDEILIIKIAKIVIDEEIDDTKTATIYGQETTLDEAFAYLKIDTRSELDEAQIATSETVDGVEYKGLFRDDNTRALIDTEDSISWSVKFEFLESEGDDSKLTGDIGIGVEFKTKVYLSLSYYYVEVKCDYKLEVELSLSAKNEYLKKELLKTPIGISPVVGVYIEFMPSFIIESSAKISIKGKIKGSFGFALSKDEGLKDISSGPSSEIEVKGEVELFLGISLEPKIKIIHEKIAQAKMDVTVGRVIKAKTDPYKNDGSTLHQCNTCWDGEISARICSKAEAEINILKKIKITSRKYEKTFKIADFYYSYDFDEFAFTKCSHHKYLVKVTVVDKNANPVTNALVHDGTDTKDYQVDDNGGASFYLPTGKHTITAYLADDKSVTSKKKINIIDKPKEIRLVLSGYQVSADEGKGVQMFDNSNGYYGAIAEDRSLYMWGDNMYGCVGVGRNGVFFRGEDVITTPQKVLERVKQVSLGWFLSAAVTEDNKLYMWGAAGNEQLSSSPQYVMSDVKEIALDRNAIIFDCVAIVKTNGDLYMGGSNTGGRYGDGTEESVSVVTPKMVMSNIKKISLGYSHSGAIKENGDLYTWGCVVCGQLGDGKGVCDHSDEVIVSLENTEDINGEIELPKKILSNVKDVSCGGNFSAAVTNNGELYMWGCNRKGQLGNNTTTGSSVPIKIMENIKSVSVGSAHTLAVTSDNELYVWGEYYNINGELEEKHTPIKIMSNIREAYACYSSTAIITTDGDLYVWGCYDYMLSESANTNFAKTKIEIPPTISEASSFNKLLSIQTENTSSDIIEINSDDDMDVNPLRDAKYGSRTDGKVVFSGFYADETCNIYEIKSKDTVNILNSDNLLYIFQKLADDSGNIVLTYEPKEAFANSILFAVGEKTTNSKPVEPAVRDIKDAAILVEDLVYTGQEQIAKIKVLYDNNILQEGFDYRLSGNCNAVGIGLYTAEINGIGAYIGTKSFTWQIVEKQEETSTEPTESETESSTESETESTDIENQGDGLWISGVSKSGYQYTGEAVKPAVKVYDKSTLLTEKTDYTVSYKNNTKAGQATITVTGKGNYSGKETVTFDILPADIGSEEVHAMDFYVKIGKKAQKPIPELYYMGTKLKNNKDFTISYSNASNVYAQTGEHSVTITGKGNYTGTRDLKLMAVEKVVKPKPISIAKAALNGFDKSFTYTGKACKQECTLTVQTSEGGKILVEGMDYTVQYANNTKAGTATVIYYGRNEYTGKLKKTYKILPYDILNNYNAKIEYETYFDCIYAKGGSKPKPVITFEGKALKEGVDYTLSYKNNKAVYGNQTPCVTVNGKGCFKGKIPIYFTIKAQDLSKMTLVSGDKVYKNKANIYKITPKLMDLDGKLLSAGKDFDQKNITYVYENDVVLENGVSKKAGSEVEKTDIIPADAQIRITLNCGSGSNYTGTFTGTYRIVKADIKSAKVTIPKQIYTGNEITLDKSQITIKLSGVTLKPEDYEIVRYDNNVKKGTASVTIKGTGNYGGIKTVKFTIGTKGFLWWWRK